MKRLEPLQRLAALIDQIDGAAHDVIVISGLWGLDVHDTYLFV